MRLLIAILGFVGCLVASVALLAMSTSTFVAVWAFLLLIGSLAGLLIASDRWVWKE